MISSKIHGVLDYTVGITLIVVPLIPAEIYRQPEIWVPVIVGAFVLLYTTFTNYELGRFKVLSLRINLLLDVIAGLFLAISPWLFNFYERMYLPHLIAGLLQIAIVLLSDRVAYKSKAVESNNKAARPAHSQ